MEKFSWDSPVDVLFRGKKGKVLEKLRSAEILVLEDLLWILPLKIEKVPPISSFQNAFPEKIFKGVGKVLSTKVTPNFRVRGKRGARLSHVSLIVHDLLSSEHLCLKFFNLYSNRVRQLQGLKAVIFSGKVSVYQGQRQILNPVIELLKEVPKSEGFGAINKQSELQIHYPTFCKIPAFHVKALFKRIPEGLWDEIPEYLPESTREQRGMMLLGQAFRFLHGKASPQEWSESKKEKAEKRLIYEEFFREQVKIKMRRQLMFVQKGIKHDVSNNLLGKIYNFFPYCLTSDQKNVVSEIAQDLASEKKMMRLLQGDVGSGKTSVAIAAAIVSMENGYQVAIMCPTESLALQHFINFEELFDAYAYNIKMLLGGTKKKEKEKIVHDLEKGHIQLIVGTHSLIQESIKFKKLALVVIDEQHKFGVNQRIKLVNKGMGVHCLIMTATPIPRSLGLTQYGDLNISVIKTIPAHRKGIKTRIVEPHNFEKFLNFLNTRLELGEQAYVVVPAVVENENQDIANLETVLKKYKMYFPSFRVLGLHGKLNSKEKVKTFIDFKNHNFDILVSTSVIEVGINIPNVSVMTIMNPNRFGLSSLHQLRGRVGRGDRPGFCFLVNDKKVSSLGMERLKVIESTCDGFEIAEKDLEMRGEGDIFGTDQSGIIRSKTLANLVIHQNELMDAKKDVDYLFQNPHFKVSKLLVKLSNNNHLTQIT